MLLRDSTLHFNIPRQNADEALLQFGTQADISVVYDHNLIKDLRTNQLQGEFTLEQGIRILLKDSGLKAEFKSSSHLVVTRNYWGIDQMKSKKNLLAATVAFFMGSGAAVVSAVDQNQVEELNHQGIDEIIVTATKREQRLIDVPISVAALSGKDLDAKGITDLQSLSFAVPGLLVAEGGSLQRRISIRGIGNTFGDSSLVGIYLDDSSVALQPANQIDLRVHDLERIEVLKGPQSTLYGEGSVGGTIRYITKDPQLEEFAGNISIDGSTTESGDTSQEVKGILNIPLADTLGLRLVGQYANLGGWIDQPALSKKDINDQELSNVRAKLLWEVSDALEVKTTAIIHRNDVGAQNFGEDEGGNYQQALNDPSTPSGEDDYDFFNLLVNYDFGTVSLISSTSYLDSDRVVNNYGAQCCGTPGALFDILYSFEERKTEVITQELRLASNDTGPWHWSGGVFYKDAKLTNNSDLNLGGFFPLSTRIEQTSESWALFGEAGYAITDSLEVGLGLRYYEDEREVQPGGTAEVRDESFDSTNPKIYLSYHAAESIHLYANAAKGFRSGGFNVFQPAGTPNFDPENVWSYELGAKMSLLDGRLNTELALFYSDYGDYQTSSLVGGTNLTTNAGDAEIQGVELSLTYLATEKLELGFTGNYMDTEFTEINSTSYIEGDPLDMVPQYGFSAWSQYSFQWFDSSPGFARIDYSQQGKSNYRNRSFDDLVNGLAYHSTSDVIDMLNARVSWESQEWSLEVYGLNLLNENGFVGPFSIENISARPRPRTVGLNLEYSF